MNTTIYYFTGTGNSLQAAREIARNIGGAHILPVAKYLNVSSVNDDSDCVGIVFPVYCWGPPKIVYDFIKKLKINNKDAYIFSAATYGGSEGDTFGIVGKLLEEKGLALSAGFGIKMPANYIPMYGAQGDVKIEQIIDKAKLRIAEMSEFIKIRNKMPYDKGNFVMNLLSKFVYPGFCGRVESTDTKFFADEKCNLCGICVKACPKNNISIENNKVAWHHKCEQCLVCLQWCPEKAIQYGNATKKRKRYRNPEIKIDEVIKQKS